MDVTMAVAAREYRVERGLPSLIDIFGGITAPYLPYTLDEMRFIIRFSAGPAEVGMERLIRVHLVDPDGGVTATVQRRELVLPPVIQGTRTGFDVAFRLGPMIFREYGGYAFSVMVEDDEKTSVPFYVVEPRNEEQ